MDRRHGKRPLPSDYASEEREDFNFAVQPSQSESQKEEASPSPLLHLTNTSDSTPSILTPHGRISTTGLIEVQDPSQQPIQQGKSNRFMHLFLFLIYITNSVIQYYQLFAIKVNLFVFVHFFT